MTKNYKNIISVVLVLWGSIVFGQDLRIPNTPAFSILGFEPTSVMRPTSAKKLSGDLLSSFDENGKLVMNIGLEVTPYWLKNRPNLTRAEYLNPGTLQTVLQTFTLSAATVRDTITNKDNLGVGYRFEIFKGVLNKEMATLEKDMKDLESIVGVITFTETLAPSSADEAISKLKTNLANLKVPESKITEVINAFNDLIQYPLIGNKVPKVLDALKKKYGDESSTLTDKIREMENKRTGFSLETAGAFKFITSNNSNNPLQKIGFWINANYYVTEKDAWTITTRLMTNTSDSTSVNTDCGLSYIRQEKDFNISVEAMMRWYRAEIPDINLANEPITRLEKDFTYRVAAQCSYTIASDMSVNLSIGKDFNTPFAVTNSLFSILGVNYSIFNRRFNPN
ncbi:hypothetical protein [Flavobacterium sp. ASV13]|uniref:hypothetical protein n=1 Tax=Flavobacterium sp. ASV13 TaxID=1506583 RepID=UPI00054E6604|nr:hypothetical protein [Flavobacterium sp. ASV13]